MWSRSTVCLKQPSIDRMKGSSSTKGTADDRFIDKQTLRNHCQTWIPGVNPRKVWRRLVEVSLHGTTHPCPSNPLASPPPNYNFPSILLTWSSPHFNSSVCTIKTISGLVRKFSIKVEEIAVWKRWSAPCAGCWGVWRARNCDCTV